MKHWKGIFHNLVVYVSFVRSEETGNSLVNCAACLSVQTQVDNWSCDVNCKVINSQNDGLVTSGIVQDLIQQVKALNETVQRLRVPTDMLCVNGYESGPTLYSPTDGGMFVFPTEIVDRFYSYDNVTGVFTAQNTGVYNLAITTRSGNPNGQINLYLNRTGEAEQSLCHAKGSGPFGDAVCLLMQRLNAGDEICVRFAGSGQIRLEKSYFQANFLYNTN